MREIFEGIENIKQNLDENNYAYQFDHPFTSHCVGVRGLEFLHI